MLCPPHWDFFVVPAQLAVPAVVVLKRRFHTCKKILSISFRNMIFIERYELPYYYDRFQQSCSFHWKSGFYVKYYFIQASYFARKYYFPYQNMLC